jgi:AcrR family transcriptional regulator
VGSWNFEKDMKTIQDFGRVGERVKLVPPRCGRPTKAAAAERDERLLEIAAEMFMRHGFDATSMERVAEAAMIGKATLYARYTDKSQLFADVLRRRILLLYGRLEADLAKGLGGKSLEETLFILARRFLESSLTPGSIALSRILVAQGERFPELGKLAVEEGLKRQTKLVASILDSFSSYYHYSVADIDLAADLFLGIVLGKIPRMALLGVEIEPQMRDRRLGAAVRLFVKGLIIEPQ